MVSGTIEGGLEEKWTRCCRAGAEWYDVEGVIGGANLEEEGKFTLVDGALIDGLCDCECSLCFLLLDFDERCFEW